MLTITIKANVPAADAHGIKEHIAMDKVWDCTLRNLESTFCSYGEPKEG